MKLALIQTKQNELYNFPGTRTFDTEEVLQLRNEYMEEVFRMTEEAAKEGADLIVTTEVVNYSGHFSKIKVPYADLYQEMNPFYTDDNKNKEFNDKLDKDVPTNEEARFAAIAAQYGVMILAGLARKENGKLYNSTILWGRDGRIKDVYHKINLAGDESEIFTPGEQLHTIDTEFGRVGTAVCWDMQFPETARNLAKMGTDLIVCPTWGWELIIGERISTEESKKADEIIVETIKTSNKKLRTLHILLYVVVVLVNAVFTIVVPLTATPSDAMAVPLMAIIGSALSALLLSILNIKPVWKFIFIPISAIELLIGSAIYCSDIFDYGLQYATIIAFIELAIFLLTMGIEKIIKIIKKNKK